MLRATATPTGGVGQPMRPSPRLPINGCRNDHSNPERAGDCPCADLAAEAAEQRDARTIRHYPPSRVIRVPSRFSVDVVGVSFAPDYPANLRRLARQRARGVDWQLELRREPANPADPNAVAVVVAADASLLGHVPAGLAGRLGPALDAGEPFVITGWEVLVTEAHPDRPGLQVLAERRASVEQISAAKLSHPAAILDVAS